MAPPEIHYVTQCISSPGASLDSGWVLGQATTGAASLSTVPGTGKADYDRPPTSSRQALTGKRKNFPPNRISVTEQAPTNPGFYILLFKMPNLFIFLSSYGPHPALCSGIAPDGAQNAT